MKVAILTSNSGVEHSELVSPRAAMLDVGWDVDHLAPEAGDVQTMTGDVNEEAVVQADRAVRAAAIEDYDGLVIPGGTTNADHLRLDEDAVAFVRDFAVAGRPMAVICHGPWMLVEADVLDGRTVTSYPSLRTDITNARGSWVDEEVVHCTNGPGAFITSRRPDDLDAFNQTLLKVFPERSTA